MLLSNKTPFNPFSIVHPCDKETQGGCKQKCVKIEGKEDKLAYKCGCDEGYKLGEDGVECEKSKWD